MKEEGPSHTVQIVNLIYIDYQRVLLDAHSIINLTFNDIKKIQHCVQIMLNCAALGVRLRQHLQ